LQSSGVPSHPCAGLIVIARRVTDPEQTSMGWLDVAVARNAWGRQLDSFEALADQSWGASPLPLVFIRAPRIVAVGRNVKVLATFRGEPILVQQNNVYGATFHPELTSDRRVHRAVFGDLHQREAAAATVLRLKSGSGPALRITM